MQTLTRLVRGVARGLRRGRLTDPPYTARELAMHYLGWSQGWNEAYRELETKGWIPKGMPSPVRSPSSETPGAAAGRSALTSGLPSSAEPPTPETATRPYESSDAKAD